MKKVDPAPFFLGNVFPEICDVDIRTAKVKQCILEGMEITAVNHLSAQSRLTIPYGVCTDNTGFHAALTGLSIMPIYEASWELPADNLDVQTLITTAPGYRLQDPLVVVPITRAGLDIIDPSLLMILDTQVGSIGLARNEETHKPVPCLGVSSEDLPGRTAFLVDPMLAASGSLPHVLRLLVGHGADNIMAARIISIQQGVSALKESGFPVHLIATMVDPDLNEDAHIVLRLGNADDRLYGSRNTDF